ENATGSVEISTDDVSYSSLGSYNWPGGGATQSTLTIPTVDPGVSTFWIKLKMIGTFGSPASVQFYSFYINAVLNTGNSNSIAPTSTQNIQVSQNGTALTVTETPSAASSREWKWSTTSGSGYQSFSPTETGTSYTPNFATTGTYYVICESNFAGDIQTSNQVQINVTITSSVEELVMD